jgi:hypothetical protein
MLPDDQLPDDQLADDLAVVFGMQLGDVEKEQLMAGLRHGKDGRWAQLEVTALPGAVLARQVAGLFLLGERVLVLSGDGHDRFRRIVDLIDASELLRARVKRTTAVNGGERIGLDDGATMWFVSLRSVRRGVRGYSVDLVTVHGELGAEQRKAVMPCLAGRRNPQIWFAD